jgi:anti-sigma B factor antagonist
MGVEIKQRQVGEITILELKGRLALGEGSSALNEKLQGLIGDGSINLVLECSQVDALDSQGISALVRGIVSTQKRGGKLKLVSPSPRVLRVLEVTRLITLMETFDDEAKALASF